MQNWRFLSRRVAVLAVVLLVGQSLTGFAAPPTVYDFRLTQGTAKLPVIKAYVDIIGAGEVPAKGLQREDLKATIGTTAVKVSKLVPFEDTKEGIGYVLLVDVSKSLSVAQFSLMKETLTAFVDAMAEGDQAALVTFGNDVKIIQEFSANRGKIKEMLAALGPSDEETAFYGGLDKAIAVARAGGSDIPLRRVIITLSDGVNDLPGGVGKGNVSAKLSADPIPLYLIGFVQGKPTAEEESAIGVMKDFASQSGGRFYDGRGGSWRGIYFAITRSIRSAFVIELDASGFLSEGATYPVELTLPAAGRIWTSKIQLTVPAGGTPVVPAAAAAQPTGRDTFIGMMDGRNWLFAGIAALVTALGIGWFWRRRRCCTPPGSGLTIASPRPSLDSSVAIGGVLMRLTRNQEGTLPSQFEIELADRVVLGSDPAVSQLVFENDDKISPAHCEIVLESGCLYLQDLGSGAGTFLNGLPLTARHRIEEMDVLQIGRTELRITFPT